MISKLMLIEQVTIQEKKQQLLNKGISNEIIDKLLQADPTNKDKSDNDKVGSYTDWIVSRYLKDRTFNDFDELYKQLEQYDKSKHKIPDKKLQNIGQFETLDNLITFVNNNQDKLAIKTDNIKILDKDGYDIFYSKNFIIHVPHTKKQSIELGSGTKWCTSQINNNLFDRYYEEGYLFYITNKLKNQERYNLHINTSYNEIEFADDKDNHLTYKLFDIVKEDNTLIPQIKSYYEYKNINIDSDPMFIKFVGCKTVNDIVQWYAKYIDPSAYIYFETNENAIIDRINKYSGNILEYIRDPSNQIKIQQINREASGYLTNNELEQFISLLGKLDEEIKIQLVSNFDDQLVILIEEEIPVSEPVQLQQIENVKDDYTIHEIIEALNAKYIPITEKVQIQQIDRYQYQISDIKYPTKKAMLYQLSKDADNQIGDIINKGIEITKDLQMQQVTNSDSGSQIYTILNDGIIPDEDVLLQQIDYNPYQITYIIDNSQNLELDIDSFIIKQINVEPYILEYLPDISEEVQLQQIRYDKDSYDYIQNPTPNQIQLYNKLRGINESTTYINKLLDVM